ncbi:MAG: methyltransferase domain-containing protein [Rhodospirillaceae bacterium]|nr:methyltransferase domain-containing protein [Rhodospirillaceae bacterium]MDD9927164.1 methyltransferase domain-containing protein [Rhodospirillaceae bacterium]
MWPDVVDLNEFYRRPLGGVARRMIQRRIREIWPDLRGMSLLGLGYATPYLQSYQGEAARVLAAMPAQQGVMPWPKGRPGLVTLTDSAELPFEDLSIDRLLMVHAVEHGEQLRATMREAWRVLSASGRILIVVPNRRGIWARLERTPFGHGLPYTNRQARRLLQDSLFSPVDSGRALYMPPSRWRFALTSAPAMERIGHRLFPTFSGVLLIEAIKQIYGAAPTANVARARRKLVVIPGNAASARNPLDSD